ncbi:type II toxin-antitoxin system VapC family toxin [bacterium]|nr:type II toxin-antitoxin system VapC family toxin [bacterium]
MDTHIWIWLLNGDGRLLKSKLLKLIEKAVKKSLLRISIISIWEVGMLEAKGRISLPNNIRDWIDKALSVPGILVEPMNEKIAIDSTRLPGDFHGDPADRIVVSTARYLDARIITHDKAIIKYAKLKHVKIVE